MSDVLKIIKDSRLDDRQKRHQLIKESENFLPYVKVSEKTKELLEKRIICDLYEGNAPCYPRYLLPDYQKFFKNGSDYLNLKPPTDIYEAINALLIIYNYVPSIINYPAYLGQVDELLEPFTYGVSDEELRKLLQMFLVNIDRNLPNGLVHLNLGPKATKVGYLILELERELRNSVPNISLKIDARTTMEFLLEAIKTALEVGKPYFVNHTEMGNLLGENYGIAGCYSALKVGGGCHTLVRLNLKAIAENSKGFSKFEESLAEAVTAQCELINARTKFIVEEADFFKNSFLVKEGLLDLGKFTAMAGVYGLYECVELLTEGKMMGHEMEANTIALGIIQKTMELVKAQEGLYCGGTADRIGFHAQAGVETDIDVTAGVRVKNGNEPGLVDQIMLSGKLHQSFDTGVNDIYLFDRNAKNNLEGIAKIINGALSNGIRVMAINSVESELVRITGYLVKRTDLIRYFSGDQFREATVKSGAESLKNNRIMDRKVISSF